MEPEFLTVRAGTSADAAAIRTLAMTDLGRSPSLHRLREILDRYPSVVAFDDRQLCGFVFGVPVSPDIMEMANLLVMEGYRDRGIGSRLIRLFEDAVDADFRAIILAPSDLWPVAHGEKRSTVLLYERLGYRLLYSTSDTTLLIKELTGHG